jgi:hypothetical protein
MTVYDAADLTVYFKPDRTAQTTALIHIQILIGEVISL